MTGKLLFGALLLLASIQSNAAAPPSIAETLIPAYADASDATRLGVLMRLQFAAARWQDAERSAVRLTELNRRTQPERAFSILPWRIYARARRYQAGGAAWSAALARAFRELYAVLPDREVARVYGWMGGNMDGLRETLADAEKLCADKLIQQCRGA